MRFIFTLHHRIATHRRLKDHLAVVVTPFVDNDVFIIYFP